MPSHTPVVITCNSKKLDNKKSNLLFCLKIIKIMFISILTESRLATEEIMHLRLKKYLFLII